MPITCRWRLASRSTRSCRPTRDAGIRATVAIDQPNVVEYDKYPFLAELLPDAERRAMDAAPRQSARSCSRCTHHLIERWHGAADGRLAAAVSCSAPQRVTRDYFAALSALSRRHDLPFNIHVLETKLQRVLGEREVRQVARALRARPRAARRADDGDPRHLDRRARHRAARASGCIVAHNPVCNLRLGSGVMPYHALRDGGRADLPRQRRDEHRRHVEHVVRREDRRAAADARRPPSTATGRSRAGDAGRADPRRRPRGAARGSASASSRPASPPISSCSTSTPRRSRRSTTCGASSFSARTAARCATPIVAGRVVCENGRVLTVDAKALARRGAGADGRLPRKCSRAPGATPRDSSPTTARCI